MEPVEQLKKLYQVERDVLGAFEEAIEKIENPQLKDQLRKFEGQRDYCLRQIAGLLAHENEDIPSEGFSLEEEIVEGVTALRASFSDTQALEALKLVAEISLHNSGSAMEELGSFPLLEEKIQDINEAQKTQLDFIKEQLSYGHRYSSGDYVF